MTQRNLSLRDAIDEALRGRRARIVCPAHDDVEPSLSIIPGTEQPVVMTCHAGCINADILASEGLTWDDVCRPRDITATTEDTWTPRGNATNIYSYVDEDGVELFQVLRVPTPTGKTMVQRHWDHQQGKWAWNIQGVRRVLYRLFEVKQAVAEGKHVLIVEGEKDVETARLDGFVATCNPMGAGNGKWSDEFSEILRGARVTIVADADTQGRDHARRIRESLVAHECEVRVMESTIGNDYTDHRAKGGVLDSMIVTWEEKREVKTMGVGIIDFISRDYPDDTEVIPGYMAHANVGIITGWEGHGKSTFMRQMAVCCAGGLNPFDLTPMPKVRAMFIDSENPEHQQVYDWRNLVGLVAHHTGEQLSNDSLVILSEWRNEPDLTTQAGQAWLYERINAYQPDIVFMGPLQNLVSRDLSDDETARKVKHAVNTARSMCGSAFILEHHAPHKGSGEAERSVRPYGSSLFLKWPDMGYGLKPRKDHEGVYDLVRTRKPRVRRRAWPEAVKVGDMARGQFPWTPHFDEVGSVVTASFGIVK